MTMHFQSRTLSVTAAIVLASVYGCYVGGGNEGQPPDDSGADAGGGSLPFSADPPNVYVAKVKNILTGLPPTDAELNAVTADSTQLGHLVDGWMATPEMSEEAIEVLGEEGAARIATEAAALEAGLIAATTPGFEAFAALVAG